MITIEELNAEIQHLDKEVKLINYEVKNFGVREDTRARLGDLITKHAYLSTLAVILANQ